MTKHMSRAALEANVWMPSAKRPNLRTLSYLLRHQELWPKDFQWYYGSFDQCALGLATKLWACREVWDRLQWAQREFGIERITALRLFVRIRRWQWLHPIHSMLMKNVTPEHVADKIDAYLMKQSA